MADPKTTPSEAAKVAPQNTVDAAEAQRQAERARLSVKLANDDAQRAKAGTTQLVALTGFTIVDDDHPEGREVKIGQTFTVSDFDLPRYIGRGRLKSLDADAADGVSISSR